MIQADANARSRRFRELIDAPDILVMPGVVEALRMVSEGLEKTTGTERLDGMWGYERRPGPDRRGEIPGIRAE